MPSFSKSWLLDTQNWRIHLKLQCHSCAIDLQLPFGWFLPVPLSLIITIDSDLPLYVKNQCSGLQRQRRPTFPYHNGVGVKLKMLRQSGEYPSPPVEFQQAQIYQGNWIFVCPHPPSNTSKTPSSITVSYPGCAWVSLFAATGHRRTIERNKKEKRQGLLIEHVSNTNGSRRGRHVMRLTV